MGYDKVVDSAKLDTGLESIAVAIRSKTGSSLKLDFPNEFVNAVNGIATRKPEQEKTATATDNGTVTVSPDPGKVLSKATVTVNVPKRKPEETFTKEYTANGTYPINPTAGSVFSGGTVKVNTPVKKPEQTKSVTYTTNGSRTVTPDNGKVLTSVSVNVNVPSGGGAVIKPITITANGTTTAPAGTDGYSPITVNVPTGGGGGETVNLEIGGVDIRDYWLIDSDGALQTRKDSGASLSKFVLQKNALVLIERNHNAGMAENVNAKLVKDMRPSPPFVPVGRYLYSCTEPNTIIQFFRPN